MLRMALIFHLFIGTTLAGIAVVASLAAGYDTLNPILIAALIGFVISIPATWLITKAVYDNS